MQNLSNYVGKTDMKKTNNIKKILWILKKSFKYCWVGILVNIFVVSLYTALTFFINLVNRSLINELNASINLGQLTSIFVGLIILYLTLYFVNMASGFLNVFGQNFFRFKVDSFFQKLFMYKSYKSSQVCFFQSDFSEKYTFVGNNISKISSYISNLTSLVFSNITSIIASITLFSIYEPLLIVYVIITALVSFITSTIVSKKEFELDKKQIKEQRFHDYYKNVLTTKQYAKEVRIYNIKDFFEKKWENVYQNLRMERLGLALKKVFMYNVAGIVKFLSYTVSIAILLLGIYHKKYDVGTFVMLFGLVDTCSGQINNFITRIISGAYKDFNYIVDYYDFVAPIDDSEIKDIDSKVTCEKQLKFGNFENLKIENVSFAYPNSEVKVLKNISLTINKGEIVCILGYNGSGKTTLSKIISGSYEPLDGQVLLNGIPLNRCVREDVFKYFGIAPQDYSCFSLAIKDIVELGNIELKNNAYELKQAYSSSGVDTFIDKYAKKDNTIIGKQYDDDGVDISGGEWQRLIIASAYFGGPEIILLDEPTASIDPLKEMEMIKNLRKILNGKTAILISHRIGFARIADRIVIMKDGQIIEEGNHEDLLNKKGFYSVLFEEQKKLYEKEFTYDA